MKSFRKHSMNCGNGSCGFISMKSNSIYVTYENRILRYPSPYINEHGEEDEYIEVGLPLKLDEERLNNLTKIIFEKKIISEVGRN